MKYRSSRLKRTGMRAATLASSCGWIEAPLFPGVVAEEFLVELPSDSADHEIFRGAYVVYRFGEGGEEFLHPCGVEREAEHAVDRVKIDRERKQLIVHA